jgi:hypothetical protein
MIATSRALLVLTLIALPTAAFAQRGPGRSIGKVTTIGNLIHLELEPGAVIPARQFDLDHRTLRFSPEGAGYRVENIDLKWDAEFGPAFTQPTATLRNFEFPFSGKRWNTFNVATGSITFAEPPPPVVTPDGNRVNAPPARFQMERYARMRTVGRTFINMVPGIAAYVKTTLNGQRFVKELQDRVVVTWTLSEGSGGIQSFSWTPTVNRIQAVLYNNGVIELSYNDVSARDGIVGVFPLVNAGVEKALTTLADADDAAVAANLDVKSVTLTAVDGVFMKATIETRGPIAQPGAPGVVGATYRIAFNRDATPGDLTKSTVLWTIRGGGAGGPGGGGGGGAAGNAPRYTASGEGVQPEVTVSGNTISIRGMLPIELSGLTRINVAADAGTGTPLVTADQVASKSVTLTGIASPEMDLSAARRTNGPFAVAFEGFHWSTSPRAQDVACSVITALGDKFDHIASYSDFRVDDPEGGTPSTGPRGGGSTGIPVTGIGNTQRDSGAFCSQGRLQFMFAQPVSTSAVQQHERSPDGRMTDYNYAVSQIAHELGHRWGADASAIVNGERINLGPTHWAAGVHFPAAFPYGRPYESDIMGGSTWQENADGTFTQLDRDFYNPAKGWSWPSLYLMGLARPDEVPPFFILRNLQRTGQNDAQGRPIYRGEKVVITVNDMIAAMGPRVPAVDASQKQFNTAVVVITEPGKQPTEVLLNNARNIAQKYIEWWSKTTGGRSTMTVNPR